MPRKSALFSISVRDFDLKRWPYSSIFCFMMMKKNITGENNIKHFLRNMLYQGSFNKDNKD